MEKYGYKRPEGIETQLGNSSGGQRWSQRAAQCIMEPDESRSKYSTDSDDCTCNPNPNHNPNANAVGGVF